MNLNEHKIRCSNRNLIIFLLNIENIEFLNKLWTLVQYQYVYA